MSDTPEFDCDAAEKLASEWKTMHCEDYRWPLMLSAAVAEIRRLQRKVERRENIIFDLIPGKG